MDVLVLEDDSPTRDFFTMLMKDIPGVNKIIEASSSRDAINLARYYRPQLILLDIEITNDDLNGLDVAKEIYSFDRNAYIVFLTGYSQYAISSFAVHPYSYILKPIVIEEFKGVIREIADIVTTNDTQNNPALVIPFAHKKDFILKESILFIEVHGKQSMIYAKSGQWATNKPLEELEKQLNNDFLRVHRSFIVNIKQIKAIREIYDRTYEIELREYPQKIPMSRKAYGKYRSRLGR